jgi:K+-transporting ATPase ATPase B chain
MTHKAPSLFDRNIVGPAIGGSFKKLDPRLMIKNPVMFVTLVGAALTTVGIFTASADRGFIAQLAVWLWFTVLFANFAEAVAEGRGKAQADSLRKARKDTMARRLRNGREEKVPAPELLKGDLVVCESGDTIPADGEVIEGIATVDEAAITGESAPVIRESGGDRSAVTGGTRVISDRIVIRVTMEKGHGFLDRMISMVEGAKRQKTPNEIALTILLSALTLVFLLVCATLKPFGVYSGIQFSMPVLIALLVCLIPTTIGGLLSAIGISGIDRLIRRNVMATSGRAVEAAGDVDVLLLDKTGTITLGNRMASAFLPAPGITPERLADAAQLASLADETPEGRSIAVLAKEKFPSACALCSLHRADAHERRGFAGARRPIRTGDPQRRGGIHPRLRGPTRRPVPVCRRANCGRRFALRRHPARGGRGPRSSRRRSTQGHGEGRHEGTLRAASQDGHPHRDDHRRQSSHRRRHRGRSGRG